MLKKTIAAVGLATAATAVSALPASAYTVSKPKCVTAFDHLNKTDNGHGTPSEWADLSFNRKTTVCADGTITLADKGSLWTRTGAGSPNGTDTVKHRVRGHFTGVYHLTFAVPDNFSLKDVKHHGNVAAAGSTAYVQSLFPEGSAAVAGGAYAWKYYTVCKEFWLDASTNDDGIGAQAGDITGKLCRACRPPRHHHPKPTPTPTESESPTPTPTVTVPAGDTAPPAQPVTGQPVFTG